MKESLISAQPAAASRLGLLSCALLLFVLTGCATAKPGETLETAQSKPAPTLEEILAMSGEAGAYEEGPRCLTTSLIRDVDVLDDQNVVFEAPRGELYLVHFERRCPGLRRNEAIALEPRSGQLCRMDTLRAILRYGSFQELGPICNIPGFQPVTKEQIALLKESIKTARGG